MTADRQDWASTPKIELHLHLEGAAPPGFIRAEAARQGVVLPEIFRPDGGYAWRDFTEFLHVYEVASALLTSPEAYYRLTQAVLADRLADGVIYAEIFLAPQLIGGGDPGAWAEHFAAIVEAAEAHPGIEAGWIALCVRHRGAEAAETVARLATHTAGLCGFGMGGDERFGHPSDFARTFAIAREGGLPVTAHAGEFGGPDSVAAALDHLQVRRIGHGVRAAEAPDLVRRLVDEEVVLEVCPGSNLALGLYSDWSAHPVAALDRAGVKLCLSTDDPPYFHTDLTSEYAALAAAHHWTRADFARLNQVALAAAFCDEAQRGHLAKALRGEA
ncbi:MAG: adenosine deaminase [Pseudomonadota bacterium]